MFPRMWGFSRTRATETRGSEDSRQNTRRREEGISFHDPIDPPLPKRKCGVILNRPECCIQHRDELQIAVSGSISPKKSNNWRSSNAAFVMPETSDYTIVHSIPLKGIEFPLFQFRNSLLRTHDTYTTCVECIQRIEEC